MAKIINNYDTNFVLLQKDYYFFKNNKKGDKKCY